MLKQASFLTKHQSRPNAPANLVAGTPTATTMPLTWSAVTGSGVTYRVYKNGVQVGVDMANTTYTVTGLTTATSYYFEVTAIVSGAESVKSNRVTKSTL